MFEVGDVFIMYGCCGVLWVVLGDFIGNFDSFVVFVWDFVEEVFKVNCRLVFYEVGEVNLLFWIEMGLLFYKVGEEVIIDLIEFFLLGVKFKIMWVVFNKKVCEGYDIIFE